MADSINPGEVRYPNTNGASKVCLYSALPSEPLLTQWPVYSLCLPPEAPRYTQTLNFDRHEKSRHNGYGVSIEEEQHI